MTYLKKLYVDKDDGYYIKKGTDIDLLNIFLLRMSREITFNKDNYIPSRISIRGLDHLLLYLLDKYLHDFDIHGYVYHPPKTKDPRSLCDLYAKVSAYDDEDPYQYNYCVTSEIGIFRPNETIETIAHFKRLYNSKNKEFKHILVQYNPRYKDFIKNHILDKMKESEPSELTKLINDSPEVIKYAKPAKFVAEVSSNVYKKKYLKYKMKYLQLKNNNK